jgi:predicted secreted protein
MSVYSNQLQQKHPPMRPASPSRRRGMALAVGVLLLPPELSATPMTFSNLPSEGIDLVFPRLADTGNAVPLEAQILAPSGLHLQALKVILPENPNPLALHMKIFGQPIQYKLNTRLRLAASQSVWVVATFSDGSERANQAPTVITSTACLDDS